MVEAIEDGEPGIGDEGFQTAADLGRGLGVGAAVDELDGAGDAAGLVGEVLADDFEEDVAHGAGGLVVGAAEFAAQVVFGDAGQGGEAFKGSCRSRRGP